MGVRFERAPRGGVNIYHSGGRGPQRSFVSAKEWAEICLEMEGGRGRSNHSTPSEVCDTCAREGREAQDRTEEAAKAERAERDMRFWVQTAGGDDEFRNRAMGYLHGVPEVRGYSGDHGDEVDEDGVRAEWKMRGPWWRL